MSRNELSPINCRAIKCRAMKCHGTEPCSSLQCLKPDYEVGYSKTLCVCLSDLLGGGSYASSRYSRDSGMVLDSSQSSSQYPQSQQDCSADSQNSRMSQDNYNHSQGQQVGTVLWLIVSLHNVMQLQWIYHDLCANIRNSYIEKRCSTMSTTPGNLLEFCNSCWILWWTGISISVYLLGLSFHWSNCKI